MLACMLIGSISIFCVTSALFSSLVFTIVNLLTRALIKTRRDPAAIIRPHPGALEDESGDFSSPSYPFQNEPPPPSNTPTTVQSLSLIYGESQPKGVCVLYKVGRAAAWLEALGTAQLFDWSADAVIM